MSFENNDCLIINTWCDDSLAKLKVWIENEVEDRYKSLFSYTPSIVNSKVTVFFAPSGSKNGWECENRHRDTRERLIEYIRTFDLEDGSNPFDFIEISFGDTGCKILSGNTCDGF